MAVKDALLALLADGPRYGYQLKAQFDQATGEQWPLNIGQVYSTLQRLARDELVQADGDVDEDGRQRYVLTSNGEQALTTWLESAIEPAGSTRNELAMRTLISLAVDPAAALALIDHQRNAAMSNLQALTARKAAAIDVDLASQLQLDRVVLLAESEIRWLELAEQRIEAGGHRRATSPLPGRLAPKETP